MTLPKPYYETDLGKLYHGDCLEIMPELEPVDLVITSPPYNLGNRHHCGGKYHEPYTDELEESEYQKWQEDVLNLTYKKATDCFYNHKNRIKKGVQISPYKWIFRTNTSHTRKLFKESLEYSNMSDYDDFNIISEASSPTAIMQTVLHSSKDDFPTVSMVSTHAIKDYVKSGILFESRLPDIKMNRKLYIAYLKERKHDAFIDTVINYLMTVKK